MRSVSPVSPERLVSLLQLVDQGTISLKVAREIFPEIYSSGKTPEQFVQEKGLMQLSDEGALDTIIGEVLRRIQDAGGAVQRGQAASARIPGRASDEGERRQGESREGE